MSKTTFELRPEYQPRPDKDGVDQNPDAFHGGVVCVSADGKAFDVGQALADGKGKIVSEDWQTITSLQGYPPLEVTASDETSSLSQRAVYERSSKKTLVAEVAKRGLVVPDGATQVQIVEALCGIDEARANAVAQSGSVLKSEEKS